MTPIEASIVLRNSPGGFVEPLILSPCGFAYDAAKAEVACGGVDRLPHARCRAVATAVVPCAQIGAPFHHAACDAHAIAGRGAALARAAARVDESAAAALLLHLAML